MAYTVIQLGDLDFVPRREGDPRTYASLSEALSHSRGNLWRYPPGAANRPHKDLGQEEVFVVLDGTLTADVGDPPERHEVSRGGVLVVEIGTPFQVRNEGDDELVFFSYGAPPETGKAEFLDES